MDDDKKKKFHKLVKSLTLYSRHNFAKIESGEGIEVDQAYIDPFPGGGAQASLTDSHFAMVIGRKGTGKSILFNVCQEQIAKSKDSIAAYVNCHSVMREFEYDVGTKIEVLLSGLKDVLGEEEVKYYIYRRSFVEKAVSDLVTEIEKKIEGSWKNKFLSLVGQDGHSKALEKLVSIREKIKKPDSSEITQLKSISQKLTDSVSKSKESSEGANVGAKLDATGPSVSAGLSATDKTGEKIDQEIVKEFSSIFASVFKPRETFREIFDILKPVGISKIYLFVDDYSELNEEYQGILSNSLLSHFHQWGEAQVNVAIASYPNRTFLGINIDPQKVDTISLDFDKIYEEHNFNDKYIEATKFVSNLLSKRISLFCPGCSIDDFFDTKNTNFDEFCKLLFEVSFNCPRNIGKILEICQKTYIRQGKKIPLSGIRLAAKSYFTDRLKYYETTHQFSLPESDIPFHSPVEILDQLELLARIIEKQKEVQSSITTGTKYGDIYGKRPPVSHFHVSRNHEPYLDFLSNSYFINKLGTMSVKKDKIVGSVYALNLGVCEQNRILFWEPGVREVRDYPKERFFFRDDVIDDFLNDKKKIVCSVCGSEFPLADVQSFERFGYACPNGHPKGSCKVVDVVLSEDKILPGIENLMLPEIEIKMIDTINQYQNDEQPMYPADIAGLVDCSYQLVARRMKKLSEETFDLIVVEKAYDDVKKRERKVYKLSKKAIGTYF